MNEVLLGLILGLIYGLIAIGPMFKMEFDDKHAAIIGAFINRFMIGFLIPNALPDVNAIGRGLLLGTLLSLPDAIITKAYAPIMGLGMVGGLVMGIITHFSL